MDRTLAEAIVSTLEVSRASQARFARLESFPPRAWKQTLPWLDRSGLALYFLQQLRDARAEKMIPAEARRRLARNFDANLQRVGEMTEEFRTLNRGLEAAGIEYAVLKGFSLIPDYCPDACLRTSYDFDYLLHPESLGEVHRVLMAAGYVFGREAEGHRVYVQAKNPCRLPSSLEESYSAQLGREAELHFRLWNTAEEKIHLEPPGDPLRRAQRRTWNGCAFQTLSDVDQLIFQGLHAFWHMLHGGCRLSNLYEVARFLAGRSSDSGFWGGVREQLEVRRELGQALGVVFLLTTSLYGGEVPAEVRPDTTAGLAPARRLWVERYGRDLAFRNFSGNKFGLFLHREFLEDGAAWREIRRRRLFPLHRSSRAAQGSAHLFSPGVSREVRGYMFRWLASRLLGPVGYAFEWPRWHWLRRKTLRASRAAQAPLAVPNPYLEASKRP